MYILDIEFHIKGLFHVVALRVGSGSGLLDLANLILRERVVDSLPETGIAHIKGNFSVFHVFVYFLFDHVLVVDSALLEARASWVIKGLLYMSTDSKGTISGSSMVLRFIL